MISPWTISTLPLRRLRTSVSEGEVGHVLHELKVWLLLDGLRLTGPILDSTVSPGRSEIPGPIDITSVSIPPPLSISAMSTTVDLALGEGALTAWPSAGRRRNAVLPGSVCSTTFSRRQRAERAANSPDGRRRGAGTARHASEFTIVLQVSLIPALC